MIFQKRRPPRPPKNTALPSSTKSEEYMCAPPTHDDVTALALLPDRIEDFRLKDFSAVAPSQLPTIFVILSEVEIRAKRILSTAVERTPTPSTAHSAIGDKPYLFFRAPPAIFLIGANSSASYKNRLNVRRNILQPVQRFLQRRSHSTPASSSSIFLAPA